MAENTHDETVLAIDSPSLLVRQHAADVVAASGNATLVSSVGTSAVASGLPVISPGEHGGAELAGSVVLVSALLWSAWRRRVI